eukprot:TRINITY_DN12937_c0_g1_i1.p1 TRINITY_DN12937_c0_g1~~TRINITY_DN12937_c0_g1_i1.p1  ORF type:complete len:186 (+),score=31.94 TRINITY_DN12937_c0_g1_i1:255-812(+)
MDDALRRIGFTCRIGSTVQDLDSLVFNCKEYQKYDSFLFYFSGHGGSNSFYLNRHININEFMDRLGEIKFLENKPKIILLDCCRVNELPEGRKGIKDPNDVYIVYATNTDEQSFTTSYPTKGGHPKNVSMWTKELVDSLNKNEPVEIEKLIDDCYRKLVIANKKNSIRHPQHPQVHGYKRRQLFI